MVPIDLFSIRPFVVANVVTLLVYGGMGVVFFLLSVQLQVSLGWRPVSAGAGLLPVTVLMLVLSSKAVELTQRIGPRWPLTVGPVLIAVGMLLLSRAGFVLAGAVAAAAMFRPDDLGDDESGDESDNTPTADARRRYRRGVESPNSWGAERSHTGGPAWIMQQAS